MLITDSKRKEDWLDTRSKLQNQPDDLVWCKVFIDYFMGRLNSRYFNVIRLIQEEDNYSGEGFSILTLQCSLIEFLEATYQGLEYKCQRDLGDHEYNSSRALFVHFLTKRAPFSERFNNDEEAHEFYSSVRCGLVHEAMTKNGWKVHAESKSGEEIVDHADRVVYRNDMQVALKKYISNYREELLKSSTRQQAFIRKYDGLCGLANASPGISGITAE